MLKQNQYDPLPVEKEVLIIFAANEGYFDKLDVSQVKLYERELYGFVEARHRDLLDEIQKRREITDDLRKRLLETLASFMQTFAPNGMERSAA
jgi:F-type H+-transporting ATPase subunit alpha